MRIEKLDIIASHAYPGDTKMNCVYDGSDWHFTLTFTSEDPDAGTEEMLYNGDGDIDEMASDLYKEIASFLDRQKGKPREQQNEIHSLDDYLSSFTRTALIAFESILQEAMAR